MNLKPNEATANRGRLSASRMLHASAVKAPVKLQILLVEDDEADAYLIRRALAKNPRVGEVLLAEDGVEALQLFDREWFSPDMAIVDWHMPRKDGQALLEDLGNRTAVRFPSIVLSSSKSNKHALGATKTGAVEFMTKPKSEDQLRAILDRAIESLC